MGKGGKRKADPNKAFQKKKQKVGGPKGPRPNETNTSFTARTVLVPTQNLTTASDDEEENGLQVADLVARCHHHKGAAKRDAVVALHKHVVGNADVVARELGAIVEGLAPLVVDDDAEVRKAVCSFQEALLETLPRDTVRAISKLLIMYVVSAMTHIDEDIRVDALASVRMWLESNLFDDVELREKMFQNLVAMMSKDAKTSHGASLNSRMLSPKSQLEALVCFRLSLESSSTPVLLNGQRRSGVRKWPVTEGQVCQVPTADDLYKIGNDNSSRGTLASKIDKSLAESVWSFLIDCWIESLPEAMNPSIPKGAIRYNILVEILKVMDRLWRLAFASGADGEAVQTRLWTAVNKHVASVFPVGSKSATKDQTLFRDLNFAFCELAGSFSESLAGPEVEQAFLSAANFLKRSLAAEVTGWTSVTATARNLMGVLEKAIGLVDLEVAQSLLEPFITAQREIHYSTPARLESTRFLGNLFHAFAARHGYAAAFGAFRAWILSLPELLWQMRSSNSHDSFAAIVDVFGRVISSLPSKEGFADADLTAALDKAFTPLFTVNVPKKGVILGPFVRQPDDVQRTLIAIAFCHGLPQDKVCRALVYCCNIPTVSLSTVDFALDLLEAAVEDDNAAMPTYLGALLSLLVGYFSADLRALSEGNAVLDVDVGLREKVQSWERSGYKASATRDDAHARLAAMTTADFVSWRFEVAKLVINHLGRLAPAELQRALRSWAAPISSWAKLPAPADSLAAVLLALCTFPLPDELHGIVLERAIALHIHDRLKHGAREVSWIRDAVDLAFRWIVRSCLPLFADVLEIVVTSPDTAADRLLGHLDFAQDLFDSGHMAGASLDAAVTAKLRGALEKARAADRGFSQADKLQIAQTASRAGALLGSIILRTG